MGARILCFDQQEERLTPAWTMKPAHSGEASQFSSEHALSAEHCSVASLSQMMLMKRAADSMGGLL